MKVSTRVEYGVLALIDIAQNCANGNSVSAIDISDRQGISKKYLEQILPLLKQAGLIKSQKGLCGGYFLACDADKVQMSDVINALDNSILSKMEYKPGDPSKDLARTVNDNLWGKINEFLIGFAQKLNLADLIRCCDEQLSEGWDMYVI